MTRASIVPSRGRKIACADTRAAASSYAAEGAPPAFTLGLIPSRRRYVVRQSDPQHRHLRPSRPLGTGLNTRASSAGCGKQETA
jgi:hypothetical protein